MIKKKLFKYMSVLMCTAIIATGMTGCSSRINEKIENDNSNDAKIEQVIESVASKQGSSVIGTVDNKSETVYVFTDASGKQEKVLVNEKLINVSKLGSIKDVSELKDIINLSGDEKFTANGSSLVWQANGNNITYQGTTDKKTPVSIKVTYYLDGKEISASDIAGKSGKVKIRYDYTNNAKTTIKVNGVNKSAYVPFTMITGVVLNDKFTNIEVVNGKAMDVDNQVAVIGVAMPGLSESIGKKDKLGDIKIPEYFEITADVTNFSLDMAVTVANAGLLNADAFDSINLDGVDGKLDTLVDGASKLEQGSKDLSNGLGELNSKVPELISGIAKLDEGAGALSAGASVLSGGMNEFSAAFNNQVKPGVNQLAVGSETLSAGINKLSATLTGSFGQIKDNADSYTSKVATALSSANSLETLSNANLGNNVTINAMLTQVSTAIGGVDLKVSPYSDMVAGITDESAVAALLTKYMTAYTAAVKLETANPQALTQINGALTQASGNTITTLSQVYSSEIGLLLQVTSNGGVAAALNTVYSTAMNTVDEQTGMNLSQSLIALQTGANQLSQGTRSLKNSFDTEISSALYKLTAGSKELADNMAVLKNGTSQLNASSKTLSEGVKALYDGSVTLKDGMIEFNEKGINVLVSLINEDATEVIDTLKALASVGNEYDSFSGKADGIKGSVKFIYKTNGIQ